MVVLPRLPKPHFLQSPLPWVHPRLQAELPGNRCSLSALLVETLETARLRAVTVRDTPVLRIERGTGLFPFLAILSNTFDALYAGRTFVLRGIGR